MRGTRLLALLVVVSAQCSGDPPHKPIVPPDGRGKADSAKKPVQDFNEKRRMEMVDSQIEGRGIKDEMVLAAMRKVPRHRFVPSQWIDSAYHDRPLPIGHDQTISQPYIVGLMTESVRPHRQSKALDVGTGSGYQAAVLAEICKEVYSIEIVQELAAEAKTRLETLGYDNVTVRCGDGYQGWPEHAPFDCIVLAAAPDHVPQALVDQLAVGGRLVLPVGSVNQKLRLIEKQADGSLKRRDLAGVMFVPMTGQAQQKQR